MELVEIRDLDGPNLFALEPVIKLEVRLEDGEQLGVARQQYIAEHTNHYVSSDPVQALSGVVVALHKRLKLDQPLPSIHRMDEPGHVSVSFPWSHRAKARAIARIAFELCCGEQIRRLDEKIEDTIVAESDEDDPDEPTWIRDTERRIPSAAITGTNGKTTTTRFLAHILRHTGKRVGWSSSSGVYINGKQVIDGDYTGHGGARRVITDDSVDCAVLETARGGILLRGLGYESNDVGVMLNVTPDHLDLHGVKTVETLAQVKATVVRTTRSDGLVVLNADDPLVLAQMPDVRAPVLLISQNPLNPAIEQHATNGGQCLVTDEGVIMLIRSGARVPVIPLVEVPLTYGGSARHMVENSLAACGAAIGMGVSVSEIAEAMRSFHPDREHNAGRLNVFELGDVTVVVDFAHNESGLTFLIDFANHLFPDASRVTAIIGTAGDRQDSVFVGLGRIAGERADRIVIKWNPTYLRGRSAQETVTLIRSGLEQAGAMDRLDGEYEGEFAAVMSTVERTVHGEVVVAMCVEDYLQIMDELVRRGAHERKPADA